MKINIIIKCEQYGTELGEECPPSYHYQCSETGSIIQEDHYIQQKIVTVQDLNPNLKTAFFVELNDYLNREYRDYKPIDYETIVNKIRMRALSITPSFSIAVVMGLFSKKLPYELASIISNKLSKTEVMNAALTSKETLIHASEQANKNFKL